MKEPTSEGTAWHKRMTNMAIKRFFLAHRNRSVSKGTCHQAKRPNLIPRSYKMRGEKKNSPLTFM